jgi:hypothetical protein
MENSTIENTSSKKIGRINTSSIERIAPLRWGLLELRDLHLNCSLKTQNGRETSSCRRFSSVISAEEVWLHEKIAE